MAEGNFLEKRMRNLSLMMKDPINAVSNRDFQIKTHMDILNGTPNVPPGHSMLRTTAACTPPNGSFPVIPIEKANIISIDDILQAGPDFVHKDKVFLCRSMLPSARKTALHILVDDPHAQRCLRVSLYNFVESVRPGTILGIMHPWFKVSADCLVIIRVDNPQHIHIFNGNDSLIRGLEWTAPLPKECGVTDEKQDNDLAWEGNQYFVDKNYLKAVEAYSKAIQVQPENAILYSNRAVTYLRMEKSEEALQDTEIGLKLQPSNVKLLYRKAKALVQLKRYEEAASFLEKASEEHKEAMKEKAFAVLVKASKRMVDEAKTGNYDIMKMKAEAMRSKVLENHADYHATDKFEIKEVPGKGRGLVAKEKIEMGTLLIATKAFVFAEVSEGGISIDWSAKVMEFVVFTPMVQKATEKLMNNPKLGDQFYKLYAGKEFGYLEKTDHQNPVDIARISGIIRLNSFSAENVLNFRDDVKDGGLWILPSYINHSCVDCNCFRHVIGDFMFVRATREINPGDELLLEYISPSIEYGKRSSILTRQFGIECSCRLCVVARNQPGKMRKRLGDISKTMDQLGDHFKNKGGFEPEHVATLKSLLKEVKKYSLDVEFNFFFDRIQKALAAVSPSPMSSQQTYQELFSMWKDFGDLHMALIYAKVLSRESAFKCDREVAKWAKMTKKLSKILYGDERVADLIEFKRKG